MEVYDDEMDHDMDDDVDTEPSSDEEDDDDLDGHGSAMEGDWVSCGLGSPTDNRRRTRRRKVKTLTTRRPTMSSTSVTG
jgi:hypothetical protein